MSVITKINQNCNSLTIGSDSAPGTLKIVNGKFTMTNGVGGAAQFIVDGDGKYLAIGNVKLGNIDGHSGISLNGSVDYNNVFFRRQSDGVVFFRLNYGGDSHITYDSATGILDIRGQLNADDIVAGTITGRTFVSTNPASGTGSSVVIEGGSDKLMKFFYNEEERASIRGYTTEGSEITYLNILAASGRHIKLKNSFIQMSGNVTPTSDNNGQTLGTSGTRWSVGWFEDVVTDDLTVNNSCSGCGYRELNLLSISQKKALLEAPKKVITQEEIAEFKLKNKEIPENDAIFHIQKKILEDKKKENYTGFSLGDVLTWGDSGLELCSIKSSPLVVGVADRRGVPIVLGAEPIRVTGQVRRGDVLVTSNVPGCAMADNTVKARGTAIAIALERSDAEETSLIMAMINKF